MRLYASNGTTSRSTRRIARLNRPQDGVALAGRYGTPHPHDRWRGHEHPTRGGTQ